MITARHLVAIDGIDGSGKSHFAGRLIAAADELGVGTLLIRVDDFRQPVDWGQPGLDEGAVYYRDYYDFARLDACLSAFSRGAPTIAVPRFDSVSETVAGETTCDLAGVQLLILEGVFVRRLASAADSTLIYLATSELEARRRIHRRDADKGRSPAEIDRRIDRRYFPSQRNYHARFRPAESAAVVIDHERLGAPELRRASLAATPAHVRRVIEAALPDLAG